MKVLIIGSGMSGLTSGAYLAKAGHQVTIYEQHPEIGGVTATVQKQGFSWDIGPLLLEGFLPGESAHRILEDLGVADQIKTKRYDRGISFPDFTLWKPETYEGPDWRKKYLEKRFPEESAGLKKYYQFYEQMATLLRFNNEVDISKGLKALWLKLKMWLAFQKVRDKENWSAEQLMNSCFKGPELKALYTAILADFVVKPSQFPAMGVPVSNFETAFDLRIPLDLHSDAPLPGYSYILGGCGQLVQAVAGALNHKGGNIHTATTVKEINIQDDKAVGVTLADGHFEPADLVVATGGAKETFLKLVGITHLENTFVDQVQRLVPMQSVMMVHLGINFDPEPYQPAALCYYYGTYDIERGVKECQKGHYHEGVDGLLIYIPSKHSPNMAPDGHHALTIYTIAPNILSEKSWSERKDELADKLVSEAERYIPGLKKGTVTRLVMTPEEFRLRTLQDHHSFGGLAPVMGQESPSYQTPIKGLWFVGSQSESAGGVKNVMVGARNAVREIQKHEATKGRI
jgi:phytoene dehydrogenase-like protein